MQKLRRSYQVQLHKNVVPAGSNQDITLAQVEQHYPLTGTHEADLDEAELDSIESHEGPMGQAGWDFDREELRAENDEEETDVNVHVNLR